MICEICQKKIAESRIEKILSDADKAFERLNNRYNKGETHDVDNNEEENNNKKKCIKRESDAISHTESVRHY